MFSAISFVMPACLQIELSVPCHSGGTQGNFVNLSIKKPLPFSCFLICVLVSLCCIIRQLFQDDPIPGRAYVILP